MFDQARYVELQPLLLYLAFKRKIASSVEIKGIPISCDATCSNCQKKGHFQKVCRGKAPMLSSKVTSVAICNPTIVMVTVAVVPPSLSKSTSVVSLNGFETKALIDSKSSESFIHPKLVKLASLHVYPTTCTISMATSLLETKVSGFRCVDLMLEGRKCHNLHLSVLPELCADLLLGLNFESQHESVIFKHGGSKPSLSVCGLSTLNIDPTQLFANLSDHCCPIVTLSCKYSCNNSALFLQK